MKMTQDEQAKAESTMAKIFNKHGREAVADACGCTRTNTYQWKVCPPHHVLTLEAAFGVPRSFLRPDLYPGRNIKGAE